jgi:hypothetical protein
LEREADPGGYLRASTDQTDLLTQIPTYHEYLTSFQPLGSNRIPQMPFWGAYSIVADFGEVTLCFVVITGVPELHDGLIDG